MVNVLPLKQPAFSFGTTECALIGPLAANIALIRGPFIDNAATFQAVRIGNDGFVTVADTYTDEWVQGYVGDTGCNGSGTCAIITYDWADGPTAIDVIVFTYTGGTLSTVRIDIKPYITGTTSDFLLYSYPSVSVSPDGLRIGVWDRSTVDSSGHVFNAVTGEHIMSMAGQSLALPIFAGSPHPNRFMWMEMYDGSWYSRLYDETGTLLDVDGPVNVYYSSDQMGPISVWTYLADGTAVFAWVYAQTDEQRSFYIQMLNNYPSIDVDIWASLIGTDDVVRTTRTEHTTQNWSVEDWTEWGGGAFLGQLGISAWGEDLVVALNIGYTD
jgi:hypothetical protein